MKGLEKETREFPACGYGLLGLCCSACLLGPCRLTHFDEDPGKALCGDDRDRMVAKHLLRLAACESGQATKHLADAARKACSLGLASSSIETSKNLLSLFPAGSDLLASSQYPEEVFPPIPRIFRRNSQSISLAGLLLDSFDMGQSGSAGVEEVLDLCLRLSLLSLMGEELCHDVKLLTDEERLPEEDRKISEILDRLPSTPCSIVLQLMDGSVLHPLVEDLLKGLAGTLPVLPIEGRHLLPEIGRRLSRKWNLPTTGLRAAVLISSNRVTSTFGALALGFNVASFPSLPVHGSSRVEECLVNEFRKRFGNGLLPSWQEGFDSFLAVYLGGRG